MTCPIENIAYSTDRSRSELILQNCISVASKVCRIENYIKGATCLLLFLIVSASRSKAYLHRYWIFQWVCIYIKRFASWYLLLISNLIQLRLTFILLFSKIIPLYFLTNETKFCYKFFYEWVLNNIKILCSILSQNTI